MRGDFLVRPAQPGDERALFELIRALAVYEGLESKVTGSAAQLGEHLFGPRPACEALIAVDALNGAIAPAGGSSGRALGYALYFGTYSTFLTCPGLYLEDLFVREELRGQGVGSALLRGVAALAIARGAARLEWSVLDWNTPAIGFYEALGAHRLEEWSMFRLTGAALERFAASERGGE